jgi:anti-sigma factor RsiW
MTCNEIENRLPAYLEDLLTPEEKNNIAGHLASCSRCSRAIADLKMAEKLVQRLREVEPPPFFEQRIMSRVREEAGRKKGILRRLFYPLHIKIPVQALATIVISVLAFHVYQQGDPEMKRMAPLPAPLAERGTGRVEAEFSRIPASPPPARPSRVSPAPAGNLPEANPQPYAAPSTERRESQEMTADSRTPMRRESPSATGLVAPVPAAKEKDAQRPRGEGLGKAQDRAGKEDSAGALETFSPEPKQEKAAVAGAASGDVRKTAAAAPARMKAAAIHPSTIDLRSGGSAPRARIIPGPGKRPDRRAAKPQRRRILESGNGRAEFVPISQPARRDRPCEPESGHVRGARRKGDPGHHGGRPSVNRAFTSPSRRSSPRRPAGSRSG